MIEICVRGADRYVGKTVEFTVTEGDLSERKVRGELLDATGLDGEFCELIVEIDGWSSVFVVDHTTNLWVDFDPLAAWNPRYVQNPEWVARWSNE